jgi:hypothetical protein
LNSHPELRDMIFGHYTRVVYLAQSDSTDLREQAANAAAQLALPLEIIQSGMGLLETSLAEQVLRCCEHSGGTSCSVLIFYGATYPLKC